ncbi:MAG: NUDIX domain-containing protein, partial [Sciscionella sp.]
MNERVRAILVTPTGTMLVIKRVRPGILPYWVLPGGGVEPSDASREAALHCEIHEELAGTAEIVSLLHVLQTRGERHLF